MDYSGIKIQGRIIVIAWFVSVLSEPVTDEASDDASRKTVFGTDRWLLELPIRPHDSRSDGETSPTTTSKCTLNPGLDCTTKEIAPLLSIYLLT